VSSRPLRRIAIVGVGLIGGSIGLMARRRLRGVTVTGVDRGAVLRGARRRGAIDAGATRLGPGLRDADLVVLALPVEAILAILPRLARHLPAGAMVTDVGSTKGAILAAARRAGLAARFVGGHPMAGSERTGVGHADARLLHGAPWILCPAGRGAALPWVRRVIGRLGARPVVMGAGRHDRVVAHLSHLPQAVSLALALAADRGAGRPGRGLAGPAFRQMTRVAESAPALWRGIFRTNAAETRRALARFERELRGIRRTLASGAAARFRGAARARRRLVGAGPAGSGRGGARLW
jgi:prephenate dehydrogenase